MTRADRRLERHIEALLKDRRPPHGDPGDDLPAMQLAAELHAAHPGSAEPSPEFVDALARKLRQQHDEPPVPMPQRRRFLAAAGLAAAAGVGAGFGVERLREALAEGGGSSGPIVPADGNWVAVAKLADIKPGGFQRFSAGGVEGFVYTLNGQVQAISAVCTDQGCILMADAAHNRFVCPCHYATFSLDGTPHKGSSYSDKVTPLPTVSVRATGEDIEVLVPKTV